MDTAFAKVVRTANGPAILIDGYVIGVSPPPELGHEICVDAIVNGLRGQSNVTGAACHADPLYGVPEMYPAKSEPLTYGDLLPSLAKYIPGVLGGLRLTEDEAQAQAVRANDALIEQIKAHQAKETEQ